MPNALFLTLFPQGSQWPIHSQNERGYPKIAPLPSEVGIPELFDGDVQALEVPDAGMAPRASLAVDAGHDEGEALGIGRLL